MEQALGSHLQTAKNETKKNEKIVKMRMMTLMMIKLPEYETTDMLSWAYLHKITYHSNRGNNTEIISLGESYLYT